MVRVKIIIIIIIIIIISKSLTNKPNSKVPHLAFPLRLGKEDHHATPPKR